MYFLASGIFYFTINQSQVNIKLLQATNNKQNKTNKHVTSLFRHAWDCQSTYTSESSRNKEKAPKRAGEYSNEFCKRFPQTKITCSSPALAFLELTRRNSCEIRFHCLKSLDANLPMGQKKMFLYD